MAWVSCLFKPGGFKAAAPGTNRYGNPTLGCVGLKSGNVGREEGDVSNAWRGAWRYSWPTELGTPVQANSASRSYLALLRILRHYKVIALALGAPGVGRPTGGPEMLARIGTIRI